MAAMYDWNGNVFSFAIVTIVQESYFTASLHIDERHWSLQQDLHIGQNSVNR